MVNDNLEVRTSVSIDPSTGAAAESALFTYEALPRASVLAFDVVASSPKFYSIGGKEPLKNNQGGVQKVKDTIHNGLRLFEALGVGGMNTRGMGRLRVLGLPQPGGSQ
ncbi:MAG: RAMP superfamily CRISPR-associated protein [Candidatus Binatia bacterium]